MQSFIMKNGLKFVYENSNTDITSFSIAFNAGANMENENEIGLAHVVEHMVFKGTKTKSEEEINKLCDEYFGFNNAMTNFPYVVYYATCLSEDFKKAFNLYSDIILNPTFPSKGFEEEIDVICQELREWKDDISQLCEDELFFNAFNKRRIKNLIIGSEESIRKFTIEDIKRFYEKYYIPKNCVISIVSSLKFDYVKEIVNCIFEKWENNNEDLKYYFPLYEKNNVGNFVKLKKDIKTAKIQYIFDISKLSDKQIKALRVFNTYFGEGTSSLLYQKIRTENGLAYDVASSIKNETGIKLFTIYVGTSKNKIDNAIQIINEQIQDVKTQRGVFTNEKIKKLVKSIRLKRSLGLEQSIRLSLNLAVYGIMYKNSNSLYEQICGMEKIDEEFILKTINEVLVCPSIQIIEPIK